MKRTSRMTWRQIILFCVLLLSGCDTNRLTGERGEVVFEYSAEEDYTNFNKPIVTGGELDLYVQPIAAEEDEEPLELLDATTQDPETIDVEGIVANLVVVRGARPGFTFIDVQARGEDGAQLRDRVRMRVDDAHVVRFYPEQAHIDSVEGASERAFHDLFGARVDEGDEDDDADVIVTAPTDSVVEIPWVLYSETGEPLIGHGVYPIEISPPGQVKIEPRASSDYVAFRTPMAEGEYRVTPAPGHRGAAFRLNVYEPTPSGVLSANITRLQQLREHGVFDFALARAARALMAWMLAILLFAMFIRSKRSHIRIFASFLLGWLLGRGR